MEKRELKEFVGQEVVILHNHNGELFGKLVLLGGKYLLVDKDREVIRIDLDEVVWVKTPREWEREQEEAQLADDAWFERRFSEY